MSVYEDVAKERVKQDKQWGGAGHDDSHDSLDFSLFIGKQLIKHDKSFVNGGTECRQRLVKVAALAIAAVESIDRKSDN